MAARGRLQGDEKLLKYDIYTGEMKVQRCEAEVAVEGDGQVEIVRILKNLFKRKLI